MRVDPFVVLFYVLAKESWDEKVKVTADEF